MTFSPGRYMDAMKDHVLTVHHESDTLSHYTMAKENGSSVYRTELVFIPGAILITGDWQLGRDGTGLASRTKGQRWFEGELAPNYLSEKFLRKQVQGWSVAEDARENARRHTEEANAPYADNEDRKRSFELAGRWQSVALAADDCHNDTDTHQLIHSPEMAELWSLDADGFDGGLGHDYPEPDRSILVAIHHRFRELRAGPGTKLVMKYTRAVG